jgi:hypothetical protein
MNKIAKTLRVQRTLCRMNWMRDGVWQACVDLRAMPDGRDCPYCDNAAKAAAIVEELEREAQP